MAMLITMSGTNDATKLRKYFHPGWRVQDNRVREHFDEIQSIQIKELKIDLIPVIFPHDLSWNLMSSIAMSP